MITTINEFKEYDNLSNDITILNLDTLEPIDSNEYEIEKVIDIITNVDDITKLEESINNLHSTSFNYKQIDRNDVIWLTVMLKARNNSTAYPLGEMGVIQCKVLQTFYGLNKLKQLKSSDKIINI